MLRLSAPFGDALLEIETGSCSATIIDSSRAEPALLDGMRVDDCQRRAASLHCAAGEALLVELRLELKDGWKADYAFGEFLDAFELISATEGSAALGMRDPEWLCSRFPLKLIEANNPKTEPNRLFARYQVLSDGQIHIQAAFAWVNQPKTDRENDSPWFAVDLAMNF